MAFVSCGLFAYSLNTIGETMREKRKNKEDFKNKMLTIATFMKKRAINRELREKVLRHFH